MNKFLSLVFIVATVPFSGLVEAGIVDNGDVNGVSTFKAESDGSIWIALDAFESTNPEGVYDTFVSDASAAGFSIATGDQVLAMLANNGVGNPSDSWETISGVIGVSHKFLDDFTGGYVAGQHWVSAYDDYTNWSYSEPSTSESNDNFGIWAVNGQGLSTVPVPSPIWLLTSVLIGLVGMYGRKAQSLPSWMFRFINRIWLRRS